MLTSPRCIRPESIVIKNYIGEIDDVATYINTEIQFVSVDEKYGITQEKNGILTDDKLLIVIDMNDLLAYQGNTMCSYVTSNEFLGHEGTFTLRGDKDIIIYKNTAYTVNSVAPVKLFRNTPEYIEVLVK